MQHVPRNTGATAVLNRTRALALASRSSASLCAGFQGKWRLSLQTAAQRAGAAAGAACRPACNGLVEASRCLACRRPDGVKRSE